MAKQTGKKENEKNTIWLYAIILFSSAFVILALTAYSQIKFNRNIDDYRGQMEEQQQQKMDAQVNLNSALEENRIIREEITKLRTETTALKEENASLSKKVMEGQMSIYYHTVLIAAVKEYAQGNKEEAARLLLMESFDSQNLSDEAKKQYDEILAGLSVGEAEKLYFQGYKAYTYGDYSTAANQLLLSARISDNEYFSDDCYYLAYYCMLKLGQTAQAEQVLQNLEEQFPSSPLTAEIRARRQQQGEDP